MTNLGSLAAFLTLDSLIPTFLFVIPWPAWRPGRSRKTWLPLHPLKAYTHVTLGSGVTRGAQSSLKIVNVNDEKILLVDCVSLGSWSGDCKRKVENNTI